MIPEKKVCGVCHIEKTADKFQIRRKPKGYVWLRLQCNDCQNEINRKRYVEHSRYAKINSAKRYYDNNKDKVAEYRKVYYETNSKILNDK